MVAACEEMQLDNRRLVDDREPNRGLGLHEVDDVHVLRKHPQALGERSTSEQTIGMQQPFATRLRTRRQVHRHHIHRHVGW